MSRTHPTLSRLCQALVASTEVSNRRENRKRLRDAYADRPMEFSEEYALATRHQLAKLDRALNQRY